MSAFDDDAPGRCLSSCEVVPGVLKRCQRAAGHPSAEMHVFIESLGRLDGPPMAAFWRDHDRAAPFAVYDLVKRAAGQPGEAES